MKFNWSIIGHRQITDYLKTVIKNQTVSHAYLFYGSGGLGKRLIADYFVRSLFCLSNESRPCSSCTHCQQLLKQVHPDIIYLEPLIGKQKITVEQVRTMRAKIQKGTFLNSYKIVIIDQADLLSLGASNAMLKIVEEPTAKTVFIFISQSLDNILPTIISRIQLIKFLPVAAKEIEDYLIKQGRIREEAYKLSRLSVGFPGKIIELMNHKKLLADRERELEQLLTSLAGDINVRFKLVEILAGQTNSQKTKSDAQLFLNNILSLIRDAALIKNSNFENVNHVWIKDRLVVMANKYSSSKLVAILDKIQLTKKYISQNVNARLALESLMLEF